MEDFHLIVENFNGKDSEALFGVFDGHGGIEVAQKLKDELSSRFCKILSHNNNHDSLHIENCIKNLFKKMDEDIIKQFDVATEYESTNFQSLGSTCTLVYLVKSRDTLLYSANIGDSKGLLLSKSGYSRITYEHKPTDDFENKRIKDSGGAIFNKRVFGQFGLSRAFGNIPLKKWVISEPFIKKSNITEIDRFIVIASDGIWDVISDEECFEISIKHYDPKLFCEELVNTAVSRWSKDNISCIIIKLNG
jgi:protein phosphatase 1L